MATASIWTETPAYNPYSVQPHHASVAHDQHVGGVQQVAEWLGVFVAPDAVVELRALDVQRPGLDIPINMGGYYDYDHLDAMAADALDLSGQSRGVYFTLNPLNPALLARSCNRVKALRRGEATTDADVTARRWLLIDLDPTRPGGISSTDAEKRRAYDRAGIVRQYLRGESWPEGVLADSGNGFHVLYRIDLSADSPLVQSVLRALDQRFSDCQVKIDTTVHNPARIVRLYGTLACKGDSTPDRPHRRSQVLDVPAELRAVDPMVLVRLPGQTQTEQPPAVSANERSLVQPSAAQQRARAYLATLPPAISGQHGHDRTFEAACRLVQGFGLLAEDALPLLREFNTRCQPPWSEEELRHKLEDAARIEPTSGRGHLLNSPRPKSDEPPHRSELPALDGRPFIGEVPDFVLSPTSRLLGTLPDTLISARRGRPKSELSMFSPLMLLLCSQQRESPFILPDVLLAQFVHGAKPPARWNSYVGTGGKSVPTIEQKIKTTQRQIASLRQLLRRRGGYMTIPERIEALRVKLSGLEAKLGNQSAGSRSRCPSNCPLLESGIRHQHYVIASPDQSLRDSFGGLFEQTSTGTLRFDSDRRNTDNKLIREQLISGNQLHWAYLPIELFGVAAGLCRRTIRLVQGLMRERTRRNRSRSYRPGSDRLGYVEDAIVPSVRGRENIACPFLSPDERYVVFGGNHKLQRGRGYPILGRSRTGWLRRVGYPVDQNTPMDRLWEYAQRFLHDLRSLSGPLHLTAAFLGRGRQWRSLDEAIQMVRRPRGRRWLDEANLRIYAPDNHLALWRRWLAGRLGFNYIPGGEWTLPPTKPTEGNGESGNGPARQGPRLNTPEGVRAWLQERGMGQAELARRIGWSRGQVSHQLTGRTAWSADFRRAVEGLARQSSGTE